MRKKLLLLALIGTSWLSAFGQTSPGRLSQSSTSSLDLTENEDGVIRCASVEYHNLRVKNNPSIPSTEDFEKVMTAQIEASASSENNGIIKGVLKIPVIVHVVHFGEPVGTGPNIAAKQVYSQIEVLNEDFRRMLDTRGYNDDSRGADVEIEFVPALYDPQGNMLAEPGINRYHGPLPAYVLEDVDILVKPATIFDPNRYLNMWTINFAALLLGYAQFPDPAHGMAFGVGCDTGGADTDGVVQLYSAFGSREKYPEGTYVNNYDLGRTATHEVGHWMGLRHVWGDGGCGVDDYCGDTPLAETSNGRCPKGRVSCGSLDMIENYMDYTWDNCMNIFTNDQKLRMRTVMTKSTRRRELLSSTVHMQPVALDAAIIDIVSPRGERCLGNLVPEVLLRNLGQNELTAVTINYQVDGGTVKTYQWNGSLNSGEIARVALPAISVADGKHTFTAYTSAPNGGTDAYAFNDRWSDEFIISSVGEKLDFLETFESGLYPPSNKWQILNPDLCESWSLYSNIVSPNGDSTSAVYLNYFAYRNVGTTDALVLPLINLNTPVDANLEFDLAYALNSDRADKLEVFVSVDCGLTYHKVYSKAGQDLATTGAVSGPFRPSQADQWRREVISLNNFRGGNVLIKFEGTNARGNNIFVDNIYVSGAHEDAEPIQLKKFTAQEVTDGVELQWQTSSEENYVQFDVERSSDNKNFSTIQSVKAKKGTSSGASYKTLDASPLSGINYYRLKIVRSNDLNSLYSQTVSVGSSNSSYTTTSTSTSKEETGNYRLTGIYPNPSNGSFEMLYEAKYAGEVTIQVVNLIGKVMYSAKEKATEGANALKIDAAGINPGVYFLLLQSPDGVVKEKVVIQ